MQSSKTASLSLRRSMLRRQRASRAGGSGAGTPQKLLLEPATPQGGGPPGEDGPPATSWQEDLESARAAAAAGQHAEAAERCKACISRLGAEGGAPPEAGLDAHALRASCYQHMGQLRWAEESLAAGLALPASPAARARLLAALAAVHEQLEEFSLARKELTEARELGLADEAAAAALRRVSAAAAAAEALREREQARKRSGLAPSVPRPSALFAYGKPKGLSSLC